MEQHLDMRVEAVGVDGCPSGWLCVYRLPGSKQVRGTVLNRFENVVLDFPDSVLVIDIHVENG